MDKTIWKYELNVADITYIDMPENAEILSIHIQDEIPCIWALVDKDNINETRVFEIYGTGHPITGNHKNKKFIGTFLINNDTLVFNVFEYSNEGE